MFEYAVSWMLRQGKIQIQSKLIQFHNIKFSLESIAI